HACAEPGYPATFPRRGAPTPRQGSTYEPEQDDGANTTASATHRKAARSIPAPILNIVAARQFIQPHDLHLFRFLHGLHLNSDNSANVGSRPLGVSLSTSPGRT